MNPIICAFDGSRVTDNTHTPVSQSTTTTHTRVRHPARLWLLRAIWVIVLLFNIALFLNGFAIVTERSHDRIAGMFYARSSDGSSIMIVSVTREVAALGVLPGDYLLAINGEPFTPELLRDHVDEAVYTVQTPGEPPRDLRITRRFADPIVYASTLVGVSETAGRVYMQFWEAVIVVVSLVTAGLIFMLRSDDWLALFMTWALVTGGMAASVSFFSADLPHIPATNLTHIYGMVAFPLAMLSVLFFPTGVMRPRWAWVPVLLYAVALVGLPFITTSTPLAFGMPNLLIMTYLSIILYRRYRYEFTAAQRQQTKWVVFGIMGYAAALSVRLIAQTSVLLLPFADYSLFILFSRPVEIALMLILPVGFAFSLLRYRLWDVDVVINRSLVGGISTLIVALLYAAAFVVAKVVGDALLGADMAWMHLVVAAVISGIAFNPIRRRVRRVIDHHLYGWRYDLNQIREAQTVITDARPVIETRPVLKPGAYNDRVVNGWRLLGVVGRGGMGEVYQAVDARKRAAAVKVLPVDLAAKAEFYARFEREAHILQTLDHPNIVKLYGFGESDGISYLAMEFIDGQELSDLVRQRGAFDFGDAAPLLREVAAALDYAHARGVVHRDIKASNIMLRGQQPILMDFGIAKMQDALTRYTGSGVIGTVDYMAPEQIMAAREVDHRADIYALGIVAYELLTGERPFKGGAGQMVFAHLQQPPPDPTAINPRIPRPAAKAILRALAKNAADRYATAGAFADDLCAALLLTAS